MSLFRGLRLCRPTLGYLLGRTFRRPCDGCGRRWHFKGMVMVTGRRRYYCDGRCAR